MYVGWNNSDCYFPLKKCLARSILFAASVVKFQHFCNHDTVFNLSDELCAGCDSKDELRVIICSEETPKPKKKKKLNFLLQRKNCNTISATYISVFVSSFLSTAPVFP